MKAYREQGGTNAVLANCSIDLKERPKSAELAKLASVNGTVKLANSETEFGSNLASESG